jgi:transcriptional regulator with XRE-family HTH domain
MDRQSVERLALKNEQQTLIQDLQGYRLSPIEARAVYQRLHQYLAERQLQGLADGQIFYSAVAFGEPAGKPIALCQLVRIRLTLDAAEDLQHLQADQGGVPAMRRERLFRMALEAVDQGARLTQEDFVRLLGVDVRTVRRIIAWFRKQNIYIPTRGYSQDIGRGTSHKAIAVRMYLQYATYSQIECKTGDTAASLIRYLKDFSAVVQAIDLGIPPSQIPVVTGLSEPLVGEYAALYQHYNTPDHQGMLDRIRHPLAPSAEVAWAEKGGPR